jgi:tetratricopeptide (TPR) repeat protein
LNNIGHSLYNQEKLDEAIEVFNKVIFYKPNSAEAYYNIATILIKKNKLEASINANKKAIFYDPELIQAHFNMGIAL